MENRIINASISTQSLTFRPGDPPVSFEVTVINDSDQFAAFQLKVLAPGASRSSDLWYRLSPEVAAAKPAGSSTQFKIIIFDTPIPAFVGAINLTVRIFSPQLREERKLLVRLKIEQGKDHTLLSVDLPIRHFQVYPCNPVDIPVRVQNLGQQPVDVVLQFTRIHPSWLIGGAERRLLVDPETQVETSFQCQPVPASEAPSKDYPLASQVPSKDYPFVIEVSSGDGSQVRTEGSLEVLPVGFIEFTATKQQQTIPKQGGWVPDWKSDSAAFQLLFKNASNLHQQVNVQLQGRDRGKCTCKVVPEDADVNLGETNKVLLEVRTKRSWIGFVKTLRLEAKALLSDQRLGSTDPATQILELQVLPVVPLWLVLALLALLAALLALIFKSAPIVHTDLVNSVRFSGDAFSVVSGSDDCTLRLWTINGDRLEPKGSKRPSASCDGIPESKGLLAVTGKPVRALRFIPEDNYRVAAGLETGEIQLWDVRTREQEYVLKDDGIDTTSDRVFDLVFTKDSRYLFSGHGSGKVRVWKRQSPDSKFKPAEPQAVIDLGTRLKFPIQALALSPDDRTLAIGGTFKRVILLDPTKPNSSLRRLSVQELDGGDSDYISSLAFAPDSKLLATADSNGYVTILDLGQCQEINIVSQLNEPIAQECAVRDRWQAAERSSVRSLVFDLDGGKLVSGGEDGRVVVWPLTPDRKLDRQKAVKGIEIYKSPKKINSINLTKDTQGTMIVSGDDDFQVKLHRLKRSGS